MGFGFSFGKSRSTQNVWGPQQDYLKGLYGDAQNLAGNQNLASLFGTAGGLFDQGQGFLAGLGNNPFMQNLSGFGQPNSQLLSRQIDQLGADIGRNLNQNILPGIQSNAIGLGGGGGARQGVAEGIAAQGATDALTRGATDLMTADYNRAMQANIAGGQLGLQQAMGGLSGLEGLFNLAMAPYAAQWMPLQNLSGIIGAPTVLGSSTARNMDFDSGISYGMGN